MARGAVFHDVDEYGQLELHDRVHRQGFSLVESVGHAYHVVVEFYRIFACQVLDAVHLVVVVVFTERLDAQNQCR